jgi:hypothetical protein
LLNTDNIHLLLLLRFSNEYVGLRIAELRNPQLPYSFENRSNVYAARKMEALTSIYCFANFTPKTPRFAGSDKRLIDLIFGMAARVGTTELPGSAPRLLTEAMIFPGNLEIDREGRSRRSKATGLQMPSLSMRDRSG